MSVQVCQQINFFFPNITPLNTKQFVYYTRITVDSVMCMFGALSREENATTTKVMHK